MRYTCEVTFAICFCVMRSPFNIVGLLPLE
jgi:hypothetical protein